jgi:hypothetical protein
LFSRAAKIWNLPAKPTQFNRLLFPQRKIWEFASSSNGSKKDLTPGEAEHKEKLNGRHNERERNNAREKKHLTVSGEHKERFHSWLN